MNKSWHQAHVMSRNASLEDRVKWHREHAKACACRPMPEQIAQEIAKRDSSKKRR